MVDAAWRRLLHRAGPRPGLPLTADADLHLVVDGKRVKAASRVGDIVTFRLSQRPESVRIVSRAAAQDQLGVARDPRELGVALRQIVLRRGRKLVLIESEDARLADGFYPLEVGDRIRWTNGDAALPAELFGSFDGPVQIELTIAHTTHYVEVGEAA